MRQDVLVLQSLGAQVSADQHVRFSGKNALVPVGKQKLTFLC